jgi:hypothetical protein
VTSGAAAEFVFPFWGGCCRSRLRIELMGWLGCPGAGGLAGCLILFAANQNDIAGGCFRDLLRKLKDTSSLSS